MVEATLKPTESPRSEVPPNQNQAAKQLMRKINEIQELPTLSTVFAQVLSLLQDINTPAEELARVIEKDQAMVPKLLKLVNSSFFGFADKVSSVQHAIMLLGFSTVRNAVLSVEVINALKLRRKIQDFDITRFWRHAIAVAVIGRHLDEMTGKQYREDAFAGGLIHDIGKIVMAYYFIDRFEATWKSMHRDNLYFWEAERLHFPIDHAAIGAQLAKRWNLPDRLKNVVAHHHTGITRGDEDNLVLIVHAADALANQYMDEEMQDRQWPILEEARKLLARQIDSVEEWMPEIKEEILSACAVLIK